MRNTGSRELIAHTFDMIPIDLVPARYVASTTFDPLTMNTFIGADAFHDSKSSSEFSHPGGPSPHHLIIDQSVDNG